MKTLTFEIAINAPRAVVWTNMLGAETYKVWTSPFCEGTYFVGSWDKGARIHFLAPSGDGMRGRPHTKTTSSSMRRAGAASS